jgi:phenylacetic acid degradation protein paaN
VTAWFTKHRARLDKALEVCRSREAWQPFVESPSRRYHPEGAREAGKAAFEGHIKTRFPLMQPGQHGYVSAEVSPYTGEHLFVAYPKMDPPALYASLRGAIPDWRDAGVEARVGVCMEMLERWSAASFELAYATMHTTGQGFMLAFAGSGASSLERGLEAVAHAYRAMSEVPETATYERTFGSGEPVRLEKRYRIMPVGIAVVVSCGSYPAYNAYPAILANLATGNPVVLKTHPGTVLPMAIALRIGRETLAAGGFDPNLLTLATDTLEQPLTQQLVAHPDTAIVDFTGSQSFGRWLEKNCRHAQVYTETSGCNAVVLDGADDLDVALTAIATSLCLFSGQMCTAAQNIFVPRTGVWDGETLVPHDEVVARLVSAVEALVADPAHAASLCGAIQSTKVIDEMDRLRELAGATVLRSGAPYSHPEFPNARTATPLLVAAERGDRSLYGREWFGPMSFVISVRDRDQALDLATRDARERGAIASYAYTRDVDFMAQVEDRFASAGASVGINLVRQTPINFAAAMSDYHVTGLNPSGNACLTDGAFVARRFRIVQSKREVPAG